MCYSTLHRSLFQLNTQVINWSHSCSLYRQDNRAWINGKQALLPCIYNILMQHSVGHWPLLSQPRSLRNYSRRNSWLLSLCSVSSIFRKNCFFLDLPLVSLFSAFHWYSALLKSTACALIRILWITHLLDKNINI